MVAFSIVIPTKNRSQIVGFAVQSVLNQTFDDFEILLIDNDDSEQTGRLIHQFDDPRIKYFRTSGLSMPDNWEFGIRRASGEYITVLEDKQVFRRKALAHLYSRLNQTNSLCITWPISRAEQQVFDQVFFTRLGPDTKSFIGFAPRNLQDDIRRQSVTLLQDLLFTSAVYQHLFLPKGLNSCTHSSLVRKIQAGPLERMCLPVAPDYTMAFQQLALCDEILHLGRPLSVCGNFTSTGIMARLKKSKQIQVFFEQIGGIETAFSHTPIKAHINYNMIVNDFLRIKKSVRGNLAEVPLPMVDYFYWCYWDLSLGKALGVDMAHEEQAWLRALLEQESDVKDRVKARIRPLKAKTKILRTLSLNNRIDLIMLQHRLKRVLRTSPVFSNLIELLTWEEHHNHCPLQERL